MAQYDKTLSSEFNNLYSVLNNARTRQGLAQLSYTESNPGDLMTSQQMKTLETNIANTKSASSRFNAVASWNPGNTIDVGQKVLYTTLETAQANINSLNSACVHDSVYSTYSTYSTNGTFGNFGVYGTNSTDSTCSDNRVNAVNSSNYSTAGARNTRFGSG